MKLTIIKIRKLKNLFIFLTAVTFTINTSHAQNNIFSVNGNVGIGTTTPDEKLAVNGVIHSKEVRVDLKAWPDYVFKPRYNLLTLNEVKTFVEQNHHLPEMPSAQEVETKDLKLGEINTLLTKKVEELTLYLFEKDAEVTTLKSNFDSLEKKYQDQQNQLHAIKDMLDQLKKGK